MGIAGLLWDIDDTLFDYTTAERLGVLQHLSDEGLLSEFDSPEQALWLWQQDMEHAYARFLAGELGFLEHRRERVRLFLEQIGRSLPDPRATDAWFGRYVRCYEDHWRIFPDVLPVLDALRHRYPHGLLSNSSTPHQHRKLKKLGLRRRFSSLVCSDEIGCAKPAAEAFAAGCAALRLPAEQVAYIGDKLTTDALGALGAGLLPVWIDRPATDPEPAPSGVHRIHTLADLPGLLEVIDFGAMPPIG
ncbi:HAD family hydrolase [Streptacidiphilus sp. N1-3]|uniref:HAD family hydrolase n=1 Tax=Streptacidiphilus alkalitolerans TaxID=3342712 RepID=A0ABV6XC94_9ACTN